MTLAYEFDLVRVKIGGAVTQRVERWTCDQQVVGSIPILGAKAA